MQECFRETINRERKRLANVNAAIDPHASLDSNGLATFLPLIILPPRAFFFFFFTRVLREQRALRREKGARGTVGRRGRRENFAAGQRKTATDRLIDPRWSARLIFLGQTFVSRFKKNYTS